MNSNDSLRLARTTEERRGKRRSDSARSGAVPVRPDASGDGTGPEVGPKIPEWLMLDPRLVLAVVLLLALAARVVWLDIPAQPIASDEPFYVNAARIIAGIHLAPGLDYYGRPTGQDPNSEHPPLAKVLMAGAIRLLGDNPYGWRLLSVITGMMAIMLIYAIVLAAGGDRWMGVLASTFFAFDNLALVHSRLGTLDMPMVAFMLLAAWFYLRGQPLLAGLSCAVAALMKLNGIYAVFALVLFACLETLWERRVTGSWLRPPLVRAGMMVIVFIPWWLGGLWVLDLLFTPFRAPWDHLHYMLQYGLNVTTPQSGPVTVVAKGGRLIQQSSPWQWLINEVQMRYYYLQRPVLIRGGNMSLQTAYDFRGAMNPIVIGAASLGLFYSLWRAWRFGDRLSFWVIAWMIGTYLIYFPLAVGEHRATYIYYFLAALPAVVVALAQFFRKTNVVVVWGYVFLVLIGFIGYFPIRTIP